MNILVTGANGQLGSELRDLSVSVMSHQWFFTDVADLDITDAEAVEFYLKKHEIDVVINCAAYTNVDKAEDDVVLCDRINHLAVANLANSSKSVNALFIHISTDYVFSGNESTPRNPSDHTSPIGMYGRTKRDGELAILASGCKYIIIRTSWLYSAYGNNFVKKMLELGRERDGLDVVFDQIGTPTYAQDLASFIIHIIETGQQDKVGIYHFSNEGACSWYDFSYCIMNLAGISCLVNPCLSHQFPAKVKRPHYSVLDKSETRHTFGIEIQHWTDALRRCLAQIK